MFHVVSQPGLYFAKLIDKKTVWGIEGVTAFDIENDLVVLKIAGEGMPLPIGDSDTVQIGELVAHGRISGWKIQRNRGNDTQYLGKK